jgi:hypothetical protein
LSPARHNFHFTVSLLGIASEAKGFVYVLELGRKGGLDSKRCESGPHACFADRVNPLDKDLDWSVATGKSIELTRAFLRRFADQQQNQLQFVVTIGKASSKPGTTSSSSLPVPMTTVPLAISSLSTDSKDDRLLPLEVVSVAQETNKAETSPLVDLNHQHTNNDEENGESPVDLDQVIDSAPPVDDDAIGSSNQVVVTTSESACLQRRASLVPILQHPVLVNQKPGSRRLSFH